MVIIVTTLCTIIEVLWARKLIAANDLQSKIFHFDIINDRVPYIYFLLFIYNNYSFCFSVPLFRLCTIICDVHFLFSFLKG